MKNHKTILASILAATLCAVSPGFASAADHGSSSNNSSSSDSRPAPAPAPVERSEPAPAPVERSAPAPAQAPVERSAPAPAPVERSVPAPVERSAPAPVTNAPAQGSGTQPLPRPPGHGPVNRSRPIERALQYAPPETATVSPRRPRPIRNKFRISGNGTTTSRGSAPMHIGAMAFGVNSKPDSRQVRTSLRTARRGRSFCKRTVSRRRRAVRRISSRFLVPTLAKSAPFRTITWLPEPIRSTCKR
jgi:hypothetical protein